MHKVLVNCLGGLSLPRKSVVRLTDRPDMTLDVYRGRKKQYNNNNNRISRLSKNCLIILKFSNCLLFYDFSFQRFPD